MISTIIITIAGITIYTGIYHLIIFIRDRKSGENITLAFFCFSVAAYDFACAILYRAKSVKEGAQYQLAQSFILAIVGISFLWFIINYIKKKPAWFDYFLTCYYIVQLFLITLSNKTYVWDVARPSIKNISLFNVIELTYFEASPGIIMDIQSLFGLILIIYIFYLMIKFYRSGMKNEALPMILALVIFSLGVINDTLVSSGFYNSIYVIEYSYTVIILFMTYTLTSRIIENYKVRRMLYESKKRYREIVEGTENLIVEFDINWQILYINHTCKKIFGIEPDECIGLSAFDFVYPEERDDVVDKYNSFIENKVKNAAYENRQISRSGVVRFISWSFSFDYDKTGSIESIKSIAHDLTEKKLAEDRIYHQNMELEASYEELKAAMEELESTNEEYEAQNMELISAQNELIKNEEMYRTLAGNLPGIVYRLFIKDNNSMQFFNDMLEPMTGYEEKDFIDSEICSIRDFVLKDDMEHITAAIEDAITRITPFKVEYRFKRKDEKLKWFYESGRPVLGENDEPHCIDGVILDITGLKNAEEALKESEEQFHRLAENAKDVIYRMSLPDGKYEYINSASTGLFGYNPEEFYASPKLIEKLIHPHWHGYFSELWQNLIKGKMPPTYEYQIIHKSGEARWMNQRNVLVKDENDKPIAIEGIITDITEYKNIQEMMIQTEKMITVGNLAAGVAHEINNPLGVILQGVQIALSRLSPDKEKNIETASLLGIKFDDVRAYAEKRGIIKYLEGMREAGTRAANIVANMLQFSRRSESEKNMADVNRIIDKAIEIASKEYNLAKGYDFRKITITRNYNRNLPEIKCIETEIEQVILNLLRNSVQATSEVIKLSAFNNKDEGGEEYKPHINIKTFINEGDVIIEISDNGPGIEKDTLKKIFEPFYTTKDLDSGTGLGLSVSYFIITTHHNGAIYAESEPGHGAKFILKLSI